MARPRIHDDATAEALLDAAGALLRESGISGVSVRAVAARSGTSFRAVYAVFGSKQALVDALAERGYRSLTARVGDLPLTEDAGRDLVQAGAEAFRCFALEQPELFRLTFEQVSAEVLRQERVARAALGSYEALRGRVQRARAAGLVHPDRSDEQCVLAFHSLCHGLAAAELASRRPPDGPGFWPMLRAADLAPVWCDALAGLVRHLGSVPEA
ncbi:TetR/AcrR family transcriptional regulator [Nocardioides pantholopis]|uniref:TetR/AcrR family transcriptional regulator n=1 Tax=Nocardioides pantholopis TaxID=2483798 RepID=UPI000F0773A3|nr:TetR/AcrR family transcriptional regulator [Nocardioides pantholopis]